MGRLPALAREPADAAVRVIAWAGMAVPEFEAPIITPFVVPTVLAALWCLLRHPDSWAAAVATAVRLGGRVGNCCWDNAAMESFFASLKKELVHDEDYATREQAKASIFEYIEAFYNRVRRHSSLGYVAPDEYERAHNQTHR